MNSHSPIRLPLLVALLSLGLALLPGFADNVKAQVPVAQSKKQTQGNRTQSLRDKLTRRTSRVATGRAAADEGVGNISGGERFLRDSRSKTAFVGRDLREMSGFVGELQGSTTGNVPSSVLSMRARLLRNANLTAQRTNEVPRGIYEPPLTIGFAVAPLAPATQAASLERLLNASSRIHHVGPLSVAVDGRTAMLEGVVASDEDRRLAEAYLRFEPSLSKVVNHLTIQQRPGRR